jgi:hypothetical protein
MSTEDDVGSFHNPIFSSQLCCNSWHFCEMLAMQGSTPLILVICLVDVTKDCTTVNTCIGFDVTLKFSWL